MYMTKQQLGGRARANKLSAARRSEIAHNAAMIRWAKAWLRKRASNRKVVTRNRLTHAVTAE